VGVLRAISDLMKEDAPQREYHWLAFAMLTLNSLFSKSA
jgi:hypothetical protein